MGLGSAEVKGLPVEGGGDEGDPGTQYGGGGGGSAYEDIGGPTNGGAGYRGVVILKFYKAPA